MVTIDPLWMISKNLNVFDILAEKKSPLLITTNKSESSFVERYPYHSILIHDDMKIVANYADRVSAIAGHEELTKSLNLTFVFSIE